MKTAGVYELLGQPSYMCDDISKEKCPVTYTIIFFLRKNSKVTCLQLFTI